MSTIAEADAKLKTLKASATKTEKTSTEKTKPEIKKVVPKLKESNEKAPTTPDKVTGEYNGKKVYTG